MNHTSQCNFFYGKIESEEFLEDKTVLQVYATDEDESKDIIANEFSTEESES